MGIEYGGTTAGGAAVQTGCTVRLSSFATTFLAAIRSRSLKEEDEDGEGAAAAAAGEAPTAASDTAAAGELGTIGDEGAAPSAVVDDVDDDNGLEVVEVEDNVDDAGGTCEAGGPTAIGGGKDAPTEPGGVGTETGTPAGTAAIVGGIPGIMYGTTGIGTSDAGGK